MRLLSLTVAVDNWDVDEHAGENTPFSLSLSVFKPVHETMTNLCCI